jgi:hypothetical protein
MNVDSVLLYITYFLVAVAWIPLWIVPANRTANWWIAGVIVPSIISVMFIYALFTGWDQPAGQSIVETVISRFLTLKGIESMLQQEGLVTATWLDNLTTGMIAGAWITRRAQRTLLPRLALLLCQLLVLAASPLGVLVYFGIEAARGKLNQPEG